MDTLVLTNLSPVAESLPTDPFLSGVSLPTDAPAGDTSLPPPSPAVFVPEDDEKILFHRSLRSKTWVFIERSVFKNRYSREAIIARYEHLMRQRRPVHNSEIQARACNRCRAQFVSRHRGNRRCEACAEALSGVPDDQATFYGSFA